MGTACSPLLTAGISSKSLTLLFTRIYNVKMRFTQAIALAGVASSVLATEPQPHDSFNLRSIQALEDLHPAQRDILLEAFDNAYHAELWFDPKEFVKHVKEDKASKHAGKDKDKSKDKDKGKKDKEEKKEKPFDAAKAERKQCNKQCARTGAACSASCLKNVLSLNLGSLVPCFSACGTADGVCHKSVSCTCYFPVLTSSSCSTR